MSFRPPEATSAQDWPALARHLARQGLRLGDAPTRQFAGGLANLNYLVEVNGAPAVFRRPPPGPLAHGASDMAREARVLARLPEVYPLAPALLHFCDDISVIGVPFQLIAYRQGVSIGGTVPAVFACQPSIGTQIVQQLMQAMTALHALHPAEAGLETLGRPEGFLSRQVEGWAKRAHAACDGAVPDVCAAIIQHLRTACPSSTRTTLLHGDFKPDNMLFDTASARVVGVIDWDMCTLGDPLFDLGILLAYWIEPDDPPALHALGQVPSLVHGWPTRQQVAQAYFTAAQHTTTDVSFYVLLGRLRLAIAWMQLYRLYQLGNLTDPKYATFKSLALAILEHGWDKRFDPVI